MRTSAPVRTSAMHHAHRELDATFRDAGGWRVPDVYTSAADEARRALAGVGLADVSAGEKTSVRGEALAAVFIKVAGVEPPLAGRAARVRLNGAVVLACRLAPDELLLLASAADGGVVSEALARAGESAGCVHVTDLTSALAVLDLLGPATPRLLSRFSPLDLSSRTVPPLGLVQGELAGVRAIMIRLDWPPGPAFRVLVPRECGEFVWQTLVEGGADLALVPVGAAGHALLTEAP